MSQISRPFQILLGAVVVFAVAWFLVLKPSNDEPTAASSTPTNVAPGVTGLTTAVNNARTTAANANKKAAETSAAVTGTTTKAATTTTPAKTTSTTSTTTTQAAVTPAGPPVKDPARNSGDPADGLLDKLTGDRVVVLLFSGNGSDDLAAARAVRKAGTGDRKMIVRVTSIRNVAKYATITDKLGINEAPSTIVIGSDRVAQVLTGIIDSNVVKQYAGDARRRAAKSK